MSIHVSCQFMYRAIHVSYQFMYRVNTYISSGCIANSHRILHSTLTEFTLTRLHLLEATTDPPTMISPPLALNVRWSCTMIDDVTAIQIGQKTSANRNNGRVSTTPPLSAVSATPTVAKRPSFSSQAQPSPSLLKDSRKIGFTNYAPICTVS